MPANTFFSLPFGRDAQEGTIRSSLAKTSRKRKRSSGGDSPGASDGSEGTVASLEGDPRHKTPGLAAAYFDAVTTEAYRTAGQPLEEDLPGGNFPHTAVSAMEDPQRSLDYTTLKKELSKLKPPLDFSASVLQDPLTSDTAPLKRRHLAVVSTIMHTCLLRKDFLRAGRAWGLLLRAEVRGRPMDIRSQGLWGIGAEILLQKNRKRVADQDVGHDSDAESSNSVTHDIPYSTSLHFTREGFDKARSYYDRLILQFPHRQWAPNAVNSLDFYPAMFGLWVYSVQDEHAQATETMLKQREHSTSEAAQSTDDDLDGHVLSSQEDIRRTTLHSAEEIASRLDEILMSLPFSDDPALWKLRAMIGLWIGDLSVVGHGRTGHREDDSDSRRSSPSELGHDLNAQRPGVMTAMLRSEYLRRLEIKKTHVEKAQEALQTVARLSRHTQSDTAARDRDKKFWSSQAL